MSHPNKVRGNAAENYVVAEVGGDSERAWGSDGRAMGLTAKDDGLLLGKRWQSKRFMFKNVPKWFLINAIEYFMAGIEIVTFYVDRAPGHPRQVYVIQKLEDWKDGRRDD